MSEFYVGYLPSAPRGLRPWLRRTVALAVFAGLAVAVAIVLAQAPFAAARFEYGVYRDYKGVLHSRPVPMLAGAPTHLLVAAGKHGFAVPRQLDGRTVRLRAALIERDGQRMLEVEPGSVQLTPERSTAPQSMSYGEVELAGEIVDTKCYLGVMNPGMGKVHKDCAIRCISGGVPAALLVRDAGGQSGVILLRTPDGRALGRELLDYVAEPVRVRGSLIVFQGIPVLQTQASAVVRR